MSKSSITISFCSNCLGKDGWLIIGGMALIKEVKNQVHESANSFAWDTKSFAISINFWDGDGWRVNCETVLLFEEGIDRCRQLFGKIGDIIFMKHDS